MTDAGGQVDILLVDDQPANLLALEATLGPLGQRLHRASSGNDALRKVLEMDFALILLDVMMPDLDGIETAKLIRERDRSSKTPIMFLTAMSDGSMQRLRAFEMGAFDFMEKPFEPMVLRSKVQVFVDLARQSALIGEQAKALHEAQARQHERELARTREEFFAVALHELRTPLTSMGLQLHSLKRWVERAKAPLPPLEVLTRLGDIEGGIARLNRLSDYLVDISRMREGRVALERSRIDLVEVVSGLVSRTARDNQDNGVKLAFTGHGPLEGSWDKLRIEQIANNLIGNAVKYCGGKPIEVEVEGDEQTAVLKVKDHGIGISAEDQTQLFHRFFRARRSDPDGFGLGLWIVGQLVALHSGTVNVHSELGQGSTFTVTLPRQATA